MFPISIWRSRGAAVPHGTQVLRGMPGPPSLGATAQSWCREGARDCKQH